jgi:hypothetical protein
MNMVCQECCEHANCQDHDKPDPAALASPATIGATGDIVALPVAPVTVTAVTVATTAMTATAAVATTTAATAAVVQGYACSPR